MFRYLYVSHGHPGPGNTRSDLDAVASIAILWRGALNKGLKRYEDFDVAVFDYYNTGLEPLLQYRDLTAIVADFPPEALARPENRFQIEKLESTLMRLRDQNVKLNLVDHHAHEHSTGLRFLRYVDEGLLESAMLSFMDSETDRIRPFHEKKCAAEMVLDLIERRFQQRGDFIMRTLAAYAHDQDFGIREIFEANRISNVIGSDYPPIALAEFLAQGELWNDTLEKVYRVTQKKQKEGIAKLKFVWRKWRLESGKSLPVVYALMPPGDLLKVSPAGIHCLKTLKAKIAVLVHRRSFISMRIPADVTDLHAGRILSWLGGGGHQGAASAGGRGGSFPYENADERNFDDVVGAIDPILSRAAGVTSRG